MSTLQTHTDRWRHHEQPRRVHVDYTRPGFIHPDQQPAQPVECPTCNGRGDITLARNADAPGGVDIDVCPTCNGDGQVAP